MTRSARSSYATNPCRGYLETIDASQFPRHEVGITATAKPPVARQIGPFLIP